MQGRSRLSDRHSMKTTGLIGSDFDSKGRRGPSATDERWEVIWASTPKAATRRAQQVYSICALNPFITTSVCADELSEVSSGWQRCARGALTGAGYLAHISSALLYDSAPVTTVDVSGLGPGAGTISIGTSDDSSIKECVRRARRFPMHVHQVFVRTWVSSCHFPPKATMVPRRLPPPRMATQPCIHH